MKATKSTIYDAKMIRYLLDVELTSIQALADQVGLSEKTVRNKIDTLNVFLDAQCLGKIEKKPRVGVWISASDEQKKRLYLISSEGISSEIIQRSDDRSNEMIRILLKHYGRKGLTTQALSSQFYLSTPTVLKILKDVTAWFAEFDIRLVNSRNEGIYLETSEYNYRTALSDFICSDGDESIEENLIDFIRNYNIESIKKIIIMTEKEWGIAFDEISFNKVLVDVLISLHRSRYGDQLTMSEEEKAMLEKYNEFGFASSILNKIGRQTGINIHFNEYWYLSIRIFCSRFVEGSLNALYPNMIVDYDKNLEVFIDKMIELVSHVLNADLSHDLLLKSGLIQHLRPTIFRMMYGVKQSNSALGYIKEEYKRAYIAAWSTSVLFEQFYNLNVTESEIGFIAIYFELALQRRSQPLKALFVTSDNISYTHLLCENLKRNIQNLNEIEIVNYHDFEISDYPHYDVIFTNSEPDFVDERIIIVNNVLIENHIAQIEHQLQAMAQSKTVKTAKFDPICYQLFDPELIFLGIDAKDKHEVIELLCQAMMKKGYATKKFAKTVIEHENITSTAIGNGVSIPHGSQLEVNEARVVIAVLKSPIRWDDEEMVDVVFLLAVKMTNRNEMLKTQAFYKQYIHLIDTMAQVDTFRSMKSSMDLYNYLLG